METLAGRQIQVSDGENLVAGLKGFEHKASVIGIWYYIYRNIFAMYAFGKILLPLFYLFIYFILDILLFYLSLSSSGMSQPISLPVYNGTIVCDESKILNFVVYSAKQLSTCV